MCSHFPVLLLVLLSNAIIMCKTDSDYIEQRNLILKKEHEKFTGSDVVLTENEEKVNKYLLSLKETELAESYKNISVFLPATDFLSGKEEIDRSKVLQFIKKIPKAGSLHTHMLAAVNVDYILQNITNMENVYGCFNELNIFKLKVLDDAKQDKNCSWKSLEAYRKEFQENNTNFDDFLKSKLTLDKNSANKGREEVWTDVRQIFKAVIDLLAYKPVFQKYIYQLLKELHDDNVFYTELRGPVKTLYDLNGTVYDTKVFFETFIATVEEFKKEHPNFVGVKFISNIVRGVDEVTLKNALEQLSHFESLYPDFIAGFDLVDLEEEPGKSLFDFHEELLGASKNIKFFFHAGETNQFGNTDLNLLDAILLNSSRIGDGVALAKHPELMMMAKNKDIAVEFSPISHQISKFSKDPRNHPATVLLSNNNPVVICNDDPGAWGSTGLSYDWYITFMSMTWKDHGLAVLKKFAQNSIKYSAMTEEEKVKAVKVWELQWSQFIDETLKTL